MYLNIYFLLYYKYYFKKNSFKLKHDIDIFIHKILLKKQ